jgi:hypothetical protein
VKASCGQFLNRRHAVASNSPEKLGEGVVVKGGQFTRTHPSLVGRHDQSK